MLVNDAPGYATAFRHLLDNQDCVEITATATAIVERNGQAEETCLLQQVDMIPRILFGSVNLGGTPGNRATC